MTRALGWRNSEVAKQLFISEITVFFQFLTTPAATHLLARASYITEYPLSERTALDELKTYLPSRPHETYGHE